MKYEAREYFPTIKIWFKDSVAIEEVTIMKSNTIDLKTTFERIVDHYILIDLKTKSFYHYSSFSDTARILEKYKQDDSVQIRGNGGWAFYHIPKLPLISEPEIIEDTIFDNTTFKRARALLKSSNQGINTAILYFNKDIGKTLFQLDAELGKKMGYPLVRFDYIKNNNGSSSFSTEIKILSKTLNDSELRIFKEWERNISLYPIR
ncbi:MAG TPA: hypothetical protein VLJ68_05945 [Chitinophagaceae bacterium]|nr:hypothetical protein [Chitinophagaceae bacterium]